ncbi:hypothetical protein Tsubulata_038734 [Turnera subulata]|uniref:SOSEKI DIX-like domain-containing protein n=1 Tax=Turnera subulata TaxID=218843 RepID=A0A9Q0FNK7_9ROSI|nr:hypothetical protein Tsubulata_038734 [Turnera subulata]
MLHNHNKPGQSRAIDVQESPRSRNQPEETKLRMMGPNSITNKKVGVVYYLSRNGQLEQPHFIEVSLSSPEGLYLRDVTNTLNLVRGQGMASMYSWSSKRRYKNGFVWEDLSENDLIHPCRGHEYILKGSLLLEISGRFASHETPSSLSSKISSEMNGSSSSEDSNSPVLARKNHWQLSSSDEVDQHKVYRAITAGEIASKVVNASTQTSTDVKCNKNVKGLETKDVEDGGVGKRICREEASSQSLRCSSRYFDSLEELSEANDDPQNPFPRERDDPPSGKLRASTLLMKLIGCGSRKFQ